MYYEDEDYPYSQGNLPHLPALIDDLEWDVLCIFDACRWDAFEQVCAESEPVYTPVSHTLDWIEQVWCSDKYDWSDVTYISGNPITRQYEQHRGGFDDTAAFENNVAERIEVFEQTPNDVVNVVTGTSNPGGLSAKVTDHQTPIVVHFFQPHNPFVGALGFGSEHAVEETVLDINPAEKSSAEAHLVQSGHVSVDLYRAAYLENLKYVWNETRLLREAHEKVITTADHGEYLGPDHFGHGGGTDQGHIVPFHTNWDVDLPPPQSFGASSEHNWITHSTGPAQ